MGAKKRDTNGSIDATASTSVSGASSAYASLTFTDVLEDLSSRFIVNLPAEEQASIQRICFQVEQAHWFYEDFLRPLNPSLPSFALRRFSSYLLHTAALTVPLIQRYIANASAHESQQGLEAAFDEFLKYKTRVPVCGAVMLNRALDKCILVKGWKSSAAWGFPKGKINQQETERDCAVREVYEETGFDCGPYLPSDSRDFMELTMREQKIRLYIVPGIDEDTRFETQTRKEISKIAWFKLSDLPTWKKNKAPPQGMGGKFYLISPFIGKLKQWIHDNRKHYMHAAHLPTLHFAAEEDGEGSMSHQPGGSDGVEHDGPGSNGLKAFLGLPSQLPVEGKGQQMIEEQGNDRSRQLLDLLRGAPTASHVPGTPQVQNTGTEYLDEREKGTASLLAALNAGAGKSADVNTADRDEASMSLLSLLNGAGASHSASQSSTPLPAPRAQRTTQAQNLLSLISPSTCLSFDTQQTASLAPQSAANTWGPDPQARSEAVDDRERDRAQKRNMLLSSLMVSSVNVQDHSHAPPPSAVDQYQKVREFRFPPPPPPPSTYHSQPGLQVPEARDNLLTLLNGSTQQATQAPQPSTSPFSAFVQQSNGQQDRHAVQTSQQDNPLLSLLNGGGAAAGLPTGQIPPPPPVSSAGPPSMYNQSAMSPPWMHPQQQASHGFAQGPSPHAAQMLPPSGHPFMLNQHLPPPPPHQHYGQGLFNGPPPFPSGGLHDGPSAFPPALTHNGGPAYALSPHPAYHVP